jgi:hypothetical protein
MSMKIVELSSVGSAELRTRCGMSYVVCGMLHVACCMLHAACCAGRSAPPMCALSPAPRAGSGAGPHAVPSMHTSAGSHARRLHGRKCGPMWVLRGTHALGLGVLTGTHGVPRSHRAARSPSGNDVLPQQPREERSVCSADQRRARRSRRPCAVLARRGTPPVLAANTGARHAAAWPTVARAQRWLGRSHLARLGSSPAPAYRVRMRVAGAARLGARARRATAAPPRTRRRWAQTA